MPIPGYFMIDAIKQKKTIMIIEETQYWMLSASKFLLTFFLYQRSLYLIVELSCEHILNFILICFIHRDLFKQCASCTSPGQPVFTLQLGLRNTNVYIKWKDTALRMYAFFLISLLLLGYSRTQHSAVSELYWH